MNRLYPGAEAQQGDQHDHLKAPTESDRIGATTLRDEAVLHWAHDVLDTLQPVRV